MKVYIEKENKHLKIKHKGNINSLLLKLKLNSETVIVAKNNVLATGDEKLKDTDEIKIFSVISGG